LEREIVDAVPPEIAEQAQLAAVDSFIGQEPRKIAETESETHKRLLKERAPDRWLVHNRWVHNLISKANWDWWTLWDGPERVGKSTAAIITCCQRDPETFADHWKERLVYIGSEFLRVLNRLKRAQSAMLDEAAEAWYMLKWYDDVNLALDLATVQLGDRNLDIHILTPSIGLVGRQAVRRAKEWVHVEAKNFERGRMEVYKPLWTKFANKKYPFWKKVLVHYFMPLEGRWATDLGLPSDFYAQYAEFKLRAGIRRVDNYAKSAASAERPKRSLKEQVDSVIDVVHDKGPVVVDPLRNSRGNVDWKNVVYKFEVPENVARTVAGVLNQEYGRKIASPTASPTRPPQPRKKKGKQKRQG